MIEKFYTKTGMYIDWQQMESLPEIDTLIDIGVGPKGTEELYRVFKNANLILIDPIDEAKKYANTLGYNYLSSEWYKKTYKVFNTKYKSEAKIAKKKKGNFIIKKFKSLFE